MKHLLFLPILILLVFFIFKTQHTAWTEMLIYPYLLNNGFSLYKDLIAPYTPLFIWFLQMTEKFLGYTPAFSLGLTIILASVNTFLVRFVSSKLWKDNTLALSSASFYALWYFYFEGNGLWFDLAQTPLILGSFYFLYSYLFKSDKRSYLFWSFSLLAFSFFIKQSTSWIILISLVFLMIQKRKKLKLSDFSFIIMPFIILFTVTSGVAHMMGVLKEYFEWAYGYTYLTFPFTPGHSDYPSITHLLKLLIPLSVLIPFLMSWNKDKGRWFFSVGFLAASFMAVFPRWGLFHLQPFLAMLAVVAIPCFVEVLKSQKLWFKAAILFIVSIWLVVVGRQLARFWDLPIRFFEPEIYNLAQTIQSKGYEDLYIFNGPDQLYLLTDKAPATKPYAQNFAWYLELPGMQERVIYGLEQEKPRYITFYQFMELGGFEIGSYSPKLVADYISQNYRFKEKLTGNLVIMERVESQ